MKYSDSMKKIIFNNIKDVLIEIKNKNYDRNFASIIGFSFNIDEFEFGEYLFEFDDLFLNEYSFFFHFLDVEQMDISDKKFRYIIDNMLLIQKTNPLEVKKILYEDQLKEIEDKYEKKVISLEVYENLKNKHLN